MFEKEFGLSCNEVGPETITMQLFHNYELLNPTVLSLAIVVELACYY